MRTANPQAANFWARAIATWKVSIALQLFAAIVAGFQMLANEHALFYQGGAGHRIIQIASQLGVDRVHFMRVHG